uniref:Uncharacterized protein n=1 Tax=Romanomermis culicivorax TaxID=13658 RepID=A0A915JVV0_ROMCU
MRFTGIFKEELKYKYAIMQALYFDILPVATQIIEKLAELHSLNWQQGISLNNRCGSIFYACVLPTLSIIKHCLCYLINCRKEEFRDTAIIYPLMKMYTVCCSMLPSSGVVSEVFIIQREIVAALLSFTQVEDPPVVINDDCEQPKAVRESLWTMALIEIMKFMGDAICNFVAGFGMLSELLPLPLPLQAKA